MHALLETLESLSQALQTQARGVPRRVAGVEARLQAQAPHLLPCFQEELGSLWIEHGDLEAAAACFAAARDAERAHDLQVEESARREALIVFALADALPPSAREALCEDIVMRYEAPEALERLLELVDAWLAAKLPPWVTLLRDVRRWAKASSGSVEVVERRVLKAFLRSEGRHEAPRSFWRSARKALVACARDDDEARAALLDSWPGLEPDAEWVRFWVETLKEAGALAMLESAPEGHSRVAPWSAVRAPQWFVAWVRWVTVAHTASILDMLERLAPRLRADGAPLSLWGLCQAAPEVLSRALSLDVPLSAPGQGVELSLHLWLQRRLDGAPQTSLEALAADERGGELLQRAARRHMLEPDFHRAARGVTCLMGPRRDWLEVQLTSLETRGLWQASRALRRLEGLPVEAWWDFPAQRTSFLGVSLSASLAQSVRDGLWSELGWPALDSVLDAMGPPEHWGGVFPWLVVWRGGVAQAVGPGGAGPSFKPSLPDNDEPVAFRVADGQVLVVSRGWGGRARGFWSASPQEPVELPPQRRESVPGDALCVPGGRSVEGLAPSAHPTRVHVDRDDARGWALQPHWQVFSEGRWVWGLDRRESGAAPVLLGSWEAFESASPRASALAGFGEASLGSALERLAGPLRVEQGERWVWRACALSMLPDGVSSSLLGSAARQVGWAAAQSAAGRWRCVGVDGRRWEGSLNAAEFGPRAVPVGLVDWPGHDERRLLVLDGERLAVLLVHGSRAGQVVLRASLSLPESVAPGWEPVLPPGWWSMLAPRDREGSRALRRVTEEDAERLLEAALQGGRARRAVLEEVVPQIEAPALKAGVLSAASRCARMEASLRALQARVGESASPDGPMSVVERFWRSGATAATPLEEVLPWRWLGRLGAAAYRLSSVGTAEAERDALRGVLQWWSESHLAQERERVVIFDVALEEPLPTVLGEPGERLLSGWWCVEVEGHRCALRVWREWSSKRLRARGVGLVPPSWESERGVLWPGATLVEWRRPGRWSQPEVLRALMEAVSRRGAVPWSPEWGALLAQKTGLTPSAAALLWSAFELGRAQWRGDAAAEAGAALGLGTRAIDKGRRVLLRAGLDATLADELYEAAMPETFTALWSPSEPAGVLDRLALAWRGARAEGAASPSRPEAPMKPSTSEQGLSPGSAAPPRVKRAEVKAPSVKAPEPKAPSPKAPEPKAPEASTRVAASSSSVLPRVTAGGAEREGWVSALSQDLRHVGLSAEWAWRALSAPASRESASEFHVDGRWSLDAPELVERVDGDEAFFSTATMVGVAHLLPWAVMNLPAGDPWLSNLPVLMALTWERLKSPSLVAVLSDASPPARSRGESAGSAALDSPVRWVSALVRLLRSGGFAAMTARIDRGALAPGCWEANPGVSAPHLVQRVARRYDLSADAAALFLQLAALAEPSDARVMRWNDWGESRLRAAGEALLTLGLVEEGERVGAGRRLFMPGAWAPLEAPHMPVERAKLGLYGVRQSSDGRLSMPLGRVLPLKPLHALFKEAALGAQR